MSRYVTFLLDLVPEEGLVEDTVRGWPDPPREPTNAFVWKVTCDDRARVVVRGLVGKRVVVLGTATWTGAGLMARSDRDGTPNDEQWRKVERALTRALAERGEDGGPEQVEVAKVGEARAPTPSGSRQARAARRRERAGERRPDRTDERRRRAGWALLVGMGLFVAASIGVYVAVSRTARRSSTRVPAPVIAPPGEATVAPPVDEPTPGEPVGVDEPVAAPPVEPAPPLSLEEQVAAAAELPAAFALARPSLAVTRPDEVGLALLARYRVRWADVEVASETSVARVEKDPAREQGKRLCVDGVIERITRRELGGRDVFAGALATGDGDRVTFLAAGSTGELVKRDRARFCGVVTGTAGGDAALFGMFDLPDNRNPPVEQP